MINKINLLMTKMPEDGQYEMYRYELQTKTFFGLFPVTRPVRIHVGLVTRKPYRNFKTQFTSNANTGALSITDFLLTVDEFIKVQK